jgi:uncharacterized protein
VGADLRADLGGDSGGVLGADFGWHDIDALVGELAEAVASGGAPDSVIGILRGGMVPAVILAHLLGLRDVRGIEITHTSADGPGAAKTPRPILRNPESLGDLTARDVMVVDDVAGTGDTITAAARLVQDRGARRVRTLVCVINTLNARTARPRLASHVGCEVEGWVRFPWETR